MLLLSIYDQRIPLSFSPLMRYVALLLFNGSSVVLLRLAVGAVSVSTNERTNERRRRRLRTQINGSDRATSNEAVRRRFLLFRVNEPLSCRQRQQQPPVDGLYPSPAEAAAASPPPQHQQQQQDNSVQAPGRMGGRRQPLMVTQRRLLVCYIFIYAYARICM